MVEKIKKESEKLEQQEKSNAQVNSVLEKTNAMANKDKIIENTKEKNSDDSEKNSIHNSNKSHSSSIPEVDSLDANDSDDDFDIDDDSEDDDDSDLKNISEKLTQPTVSQDDFNELRKEVRDVGARKEWLFEVRSIVSKEIKSLFAKLKDLKETRDDLTLQVQSLKEEREVINVDIKKNISKIKSIQKVGSDGKKVNVSKIKKELDKLQYYLETNPLSPEDEKKIMRQVKEKEKLIEKHGGLETVDDSPKDLSKVINDLKDKSNKVHDKVQENAIESQLKHEFMISVSKNIKFLKAREKEIHSLFVEVKDVYKVKRRLLMQNRKFYAQSNSNKKKSSRKLTEKDMIRKVEETVQEKLKLGKKITTEDLLSFR